MIATARLGQRFRLNREHLMRLEIHSSHIAVSESTQVYIERRLGFALGRFADVVERWHGSLIVAQHGASSISVWSTTALKLRRLLTDSR